MSFPQFIYIEMLISVQWTAIQTAIYGAAIAFAKACVIIPLIKIFAPFKRGPYYWSLWGLLIVVSLFYFAGIFVVIFLCNPRERIWNPFITEGSCVNKPAIWLVSSVWNVIS